MRLIDADELYSNMDHLLSGPFEKIATKADILLLITLAPTIGEEPEEEE